MADKAELRQKIEELKCAFGGRKHGGTRILLDRDRLLIDLLNEIVDALPE